MSKEDNNQEIRYKIGQGDNAEELTQKQIVDLVLKGMDLARKGTLFPPDPVDLILFPPEIIKGFRAINKEVQKGVGNYIRNTQGVTAQPWLGKVDSPDDYNILLDHPGANSITPPDKTKTKINLHPDPAFTLPDQIKIDESVGGSIDFNYPGMESITPPDITGLKSGTIDMPGSSTYKNNSGWDVFTDDSVMSGLPASSYVGVHPAERILPSGMGDFSPSGLLGSIFGSLGLGGGTPDPGWMIKDESWGTSSRGRGGLGGSLGDFASVGGGDLGGILGGLLGGTNGENPLQPLEDAIDSIIGRNGDLLGSFEETLGGIESLGGTVADTLAGSFSDMGMSLIKSSLNYFGKLGLLTSLSGQAFTALKSMNPVTALAAGAALMALSSQLKRLGSSVGSGSTPSVSGSSALSSTGQSKQEQQKPATDIKIVIVDSGGGRSGNINDMDRVLGRADIDRALREQLYEMTRTGSSALTGISN